MAIGVIGQILFESRPGASNTGIYCGEETVAPFGLTPGHRSRKCRIGGIECPVCEVNGVPKRNAEILDVDLPIDVARRTAADDAGAMALWSAHQHPIPRCRGFHSLEIGV